LLIGVFFGCQVGAYYETPAAKPINITQDKKSTILLPEAQGTVTERIFFDISINGAEPERIIIGLYGEDCPITCKNFSSICQIKTAENKNENETENLIKTENEKKLNFSSSIFHRIIPGFMIQGGDITNKDGTGGESKLSYFLFLFFYWFGLEKFTKILSHEITFLILILIFYFLICSL
jgi:hypothetical protein